MPHGLLGLPTTRSGRWLRRIASAATLSLAAATLVTTQASASPQHPFAPSAAALNRIQQAWSAVPQYAGSPALDTGHLADPSGGSMAGATVLAFPESQNVRVGQVLAPVSRATTDSAGNYTLRLPSAKWTQLRGLRNEDYANVHVIAFYPDAVASYFTPVKLSARTAGSTTMVLRQLPAANASKARAAAEAAAQAAPDEQVPAGCAVQSRKVYANRPLVVGYKSTLTASHINYAKYTYTSSASQTTGAGISFSGWNTGFSADGSTTQTSGVTIPFPTITGASNNDMTVYSTWYDDYLFCANPAGYGDYYEYDMTFNSVNTEDGTPGAPAVAAGKCSLEAPGVPISYTQTTQTAWSGGANVSGVIGINLKSQDGWTGSSALTYDLKVKAPICGVSNYPNGNDPSAGYLQVH